MSSKLDRKESSSDLDVVCFDIGNHLFGFAGDVFQIFAIRVLHKLLRSSDGNIAVAKFNIRHTDTLGVEIMNSHPVNACLDGDFRVVHVTADVG